MVRTPRSGPGFALIVVLMGLAVITALTLATSDRLMSVALRGEADLTLSQQDHIDNVVLDVVLRLGAATILDGGPLDLDLDGEVVRVTLQDVGGLVDLNEGDPALVTAVLDHLEVPVEGRLRRLAVLERGRFTSLREAAVVLGVPPERRAELPFLATVWSGQPGVAAPSPELGAVLSGGGTEGTGLSRLLYVVVVEPSEGGVRRALATVRLAPSVRERGVMEGY